MIERIWVFALAPSNQDRGLFLQRIEWLHLTDVVFFVNGCEECRFNLPASREVRITQTASRLAELGVDTHLITWVRPVRTYMTDCANRLRPLCQTIGARSLVFDAEGPWTRNRQCDTGPRCEGQRGAAWARTILREHWPFTDWPCDLGVSGITYIPDAVRALAGC
jgi:hypothetical protein